MSTPVYALNLFNVSNREAAVGEIEDLRPILKDATAHDSPAQA